MRALVVAGLILTIVGAATVDLSAESKKTGSNQQEQLICPVLGKPISDRKHFVKYDGGKVYFCCDGCVAKFAKDSKSYSRKARLQLAQLGQAVQKACPIMGGDFNAKYVVNVAGVNVKVCCADCLKKLRKATPEEKLDLVFSKKPFHDAFEVKE